MELLTWIYYRYIFLRTHRLGRAAASVIAAPKVPSRETWNSQYQDGHWGRLNDLCEQAHNAVVVSYIAHLRPGSSVLEIGCGEGTLLRRLKEVGYTRYTGIDISETAIDRCERWRDENTTFVATDAEHYTPDRRFDVIVLNESVYYFVQPIETLQHYSRYLGPDGLFVVSIFETMRTRAIRRQLEETFCVVDETMVSNSKGSWCCLVLSPAVMDAGRGPFAVDVGGNAR